MKKVILISGKAQNGKDTVANILREVLHENGERVLVTHYADLLKYICRNYFEWDGKKDEKGRRMLQYVGTEVIRRQNPTLWVDFVSMMLKYFHENWEYVIIPDCRFPNEITGMIQSGFNVVHLKVVREGFASPLTEEQQHHSSETALDEVVPDFYVKNNGSLEDLSKAVTRWVKEVLYEETL